MVKQMSREQIIDKLMSSADHISIVLAAARERITVQEYNELSMALDSFDDIVQRLSE